MTADALPPPVSPFPAGMALLGGAAVSVFLFVREDVPPWVGPVVGLVVASLVYLAGTRRDRRRRHLAKEPFPAAWRATLEDWVAFYRALDEPEKRRFEREVRFFLDEQVVTGPRGAALDEALRLLVAASAVVLVFGRRGFRYPRLRDVVVYDDAFDEGYEVREDGDILGMVHGQGPILFSARSLQEGFRDANDGRNVGYHEFAHVLDFEQGRADGVPGFMPWRVVQPWLEAMHRETSRVRRRRSLLRQYAAENEAEFFAVASEAFFEQPDEMRRKHPELYGLLRDTYGQDPPRSPELSR